MQKKYLLFHARWNERIANKINGFPDYNYY